MVAFFGAVETHCVRHVYRSSIIQVSRRRGDGSWYFLPHFYDHARIVRFICGVRCPPVYHGHRSAGRAAAAAAAAATATAAAAAASVGQHDRARCSTSNHSNNEQLRPDHRAALERFHPTHRPIASRTASGVHTPAGGPQVRSTPPQRLLRIFSVHLGNMSGFLLRGFIFSECCPGTRAILGQCRSSPCTGPRYVDRLVFSLPIVEFRQWLHIKVRVLPRHMDH